MTEDTFYSRWRRVAPLIALGGFASLIGPLLNFVFWPPSSRGQTFDYISDLIVLLWPTQILALGTPEPSAVAIVFLVLTNALAYLLAGSAFVAMVKRGVRPVYSLTVLLAVPVTWQLWLSGYSLHFINWVSFTTALVFYLSVGLAALLIITTRIKK